MTGFEVLIHRILVAESRSNILIRESRNKEVDLTQKSRGFLVSELTAIGTTPDEAYEIICDHFSSGAEYDEDMPDVSQAMEFLEYCID